MHNFGFVYFVPVASISDVQHAQAEKIAENADTIMEIVEFEPYKRAWWSIARKA